MKTPVPARAQRPQGPREGNLCQDEAQNSSILFSYTELPAIFPVPLVCRSFDEFPEIARNEEKARLDNFAIELQNDPSSKGYVTVNPRQNGRSGAAQTRSTKIVDYLVNSRGLDARRIITVIGAP